MGGLLGDVGEFITGRRGGVRNIRDIERGVVNIERTLDRVENFDERREVRNNRADVQVIRSREQLETALDRYESRRDRDGERDDRDDDRRGDFAAGRGGQGPRGLSGGQLRGDERGGQGQGQDPRILATEDYVFALADAAQSPAGSPERAAAMQKAKDILTKPENGLIQSDGSVRFPEGMKVILESNGKQGSYIEFNGVHARATSPEVSIQKGVNAVAGQRIGTPLTDADIAALRGTAAPTIAVGTGEQPKPATPQAPGTAKPDAPGAATFSLPEASGPAAKIYTKNGEGRTMNDEDAPKISASQVEAIQEKLGVKADGKWGPNTQAAFADAAKKAGVNPSDVDFTNPNDPETVKVMAQFNGAAKGNAPAAVTASTPEPLLTNTAAPDATRLEAAVKLIEVGAGEDRKVDAQTIAAIQQDSAVLQSVRRTFDLDNNGTVTEAETKLIVDAAAKLPKPITIEGGAAALNPLFAGASFAPTQSTADIAFNDAPAPSQAQTAQVNVQTGEVKPPAAALASADIKTENAVYVVPEPTFEPSSQGVPTAPGFVRGGGVTIA